MKGLNEEGKRNLTFLLDKIYSREEIEISLWNDRAADPRRCCSIGLLCTTQARGQQLRSDRLSRLLSEPSSPNGEATPMRWSPSNEISADQKQMQRPRKTPPG